MAKTEEQEKGNYEIFERAKTKKYKNDSENKIPEKEDIIETETRWEKAWTQEEWLERIREKQEILDKEEEERNKRIELSRKLKQGWELLRICKELMETEG